MMKTRYLALLTIIMVLTLLTTATVPAMAAGLQKTQLTANAPASVYSKQTFDITGKLVGGSAGTGISDVKVTVYRSINGKDWTTVGTDLTDSGGYYSVATSESTVGKYFYRATFAGSKLYAKVTSDKISVNVDPTIATKLVLDGGNTVTVENTMHMVARLTDGAGLPVKDEYVIFTVYKGTEYMQSMWDLTGEDGYAVGSMCAYSPGLYTVVATFEGTSTYAPATSNSLSVEAKDIQHITTALTLSSNTEEIFTGQEFTLSGALTSPDSLYVFGKTIHILRYNKDISNWEPVTIAETDGAGKYSVKISEAAPGEYNYIATFTELPVYIGSASGVCTVSVVDIKLTTPTIVSPADGTVFSHYPRTTTLMWNNVPDATSYKIEIEYDSAGSWYDVPYIGDGVIITDTDYTFDFVGAQPGRWRVTALDSTGTRLSSDPSAWSVFEYTV